MEWFDKAKEKIHKTYITTYSSVTGPLATSKFLTEGVLTPEEFVKAGDLLVYKCPTWQWESGDPAKAVPYLPKDKQFLKTNNVPCLMRVTTLEKSVNQAEDEEVEIDGDAGWVTTHANATKEGEEDDIPEIDVGDKDKKEGSTSSSSSAANEIEEKGKEGDDEEGEEDGDDDDIPDMEEFDTEDNLVEEEADPSALTQEDSDAILKTRTYDISMTYDKYYQTPKVWLFGYDENRQPLKPKEVFMDISQDHAKKTVTIDNHPHLSVACAYIHPCKHANVMKKIVLRQAESGKEPRVDQYLFLFLKFLSAVIPTIEYDYTIEMEG
ncbi:Ubiquitin-like-conjugating enzyme ATG3 [Balamuthia mandrillaris]